MGQDENYYSTLKQLPDDLRREYLTAMHDCAFLDYDESKLRESDVFNRSLMRDVSWNNLLGRYRRLARGDAALSRYKFVYQLPYGRDHVTFLPLKFGVDPSSKPPSNIHALIGRNSVGKTRALNLMARSLIQPMSDPNEVGSFSFDEENSVSFSFEPDAPLARFSGVITVSFSAFDRFGPQENSESEVSYAHVGLKKSERQSSDDLVSDSDLREIGLMQKTFAELAHEFAKSAKACRVGQRREVWQDTLKILESDPLFLENDLSALANRNVTTTFDTRYFSKLSSGHGIVLLIVTRLVELVEEQTLVLIDEPETHLHPPLLATFVRALSELMSRRNGVAIMATHSPVVLQEVSKDCAIKLYRHDFDLTAAPPEIETFGESVGALTRDVFGLEVVQSGFHAVLSAEAEKSGATFEGLMQEYGGEIGSEGRAILRSLIAQKVNF